MKDSSTYFACAIAVFIVGAMTVGGLCNAAVLYEKIYWVPAIINFLAYAYAIIKLVSLGRKANVEAAKEAGEKAKKKGGK